MPTFDASPLPSPLASLLTLAQAANPKEGLLLVRFYKDGRLQLDEMVSQTYPLADIQLALDDMHAGKLNRGVLTLT